MKKIPYRYTDFKDLIENNCYYVDKTNYIEKLENNNDAIIYLRPRIFGKTLFTSMLYYYYDINNKDNFDYLFKDTYIYEHPTDKRNNYYVLRFDFSGINSASSEDELKEKFNFSVRKSVERFLTKYNLNYKIDYSLDASEIINSLFTYKFDHQIYVLIDEYDNFTNSLLKENASVFTKILGKDGFVRDFYAFLKQFTGDVIGKIFITGVCSVSLDSMTSGFNIGSNITNDYNFNAMTGITHEELKEVLNYYGINKNIFKIMEDNYDGYKFNKKVNYKLFNPNLAMYFLNYYITYKEAPDEMIDANIYSDYKQIENIVKLFNNDVNERIIKEILENKSISGSLKQNFNILGHEYDQNYIISMLYYFGYLTIKSEVEDTDDILFTIPNRAMEFVFNDYFVNILNKNKIEINTQTKVDIAKCLNNGSIDSLNKYASIILKEIDNELFKGFNERDIEIIYFTLMKGVTSYNTYTEHQANGGHIDLYIKGKKTLSYNYIIEFKHIKKSLYTEKLLEEKIEKAKDQLIKYSEDSRINKNKLKKYIVVYVGRDLKKVLEI